MTLKVLFIWAVPQELKDYLKTGLQGVDNLELIFPDAVDEETFQELGATADVIIGWRPSRELLDKAKNLKALINPGVGVRHHINNFRELNQSRKVLLTNGHGNTYFAAQHAVALLLALMNKVIPHHNWMFEGKWRKGEVDGRSVPLRNRQVGLLGYGAINRKTHKMLSGFDVDFHGLKRTPNLPDNVPTEIKFYTVPELREFLKAIDILIVALPETEETVGMIKLEELELLGENGIVVNVGRGSIIDESSLFEVLTNKRIAGAAIDVWYNYHPEPDDLGHMWPFDEPFNELDNIVMSPHRGASPMNDLSRWDEVILNLRRMAEGRTDLINIVNLENGY